MNYIILPKEDVMPIEHVEENSAGDFSIWSTSLKVMWHFPRHHPGGKCRRLFYNDDDDE